MESKWLEDFLLLLETGNFSKAAERRHLSQPAFSRRIQALEEWLGVPLVNRDRKPITFTPLALEYQTEIRNLLGNMYRIRSQMRAEDSGTNRIVLAAQHTLSTEYVPQLIRHLESSGFHFSYRLHSANKWDCVSSLMQGLSHFLVCYESLANPGRLNASTMNRMVVGRERLRLVSAAQSGKPLHDVIPGQPLSMLTYPKDSFLGQVIWGERLPQLMRTTIINTICESALTLGIREMAINGLGLAWLPETLIKADLEKGVLLPMDNISQPCDLEIVIYTARHAATPDVEQIWDFMSKNIVKK